jgi:hypothetical protein
LRVLKGSPPQKPRLREHPGFSYFCLGLLILLEGWAGGKRRRRWLG